MKQIHFLSIHKTVQSKKEKLSSIHSLDSSDSFGAHLFWGSLSRVDLNKSEEMKKLLPPAAYSFALQDMIWRRAFLGGILIKF